MKNDKRICKPNFSKSPLVGDIIVKLKCGKKGIISDKEYSKIKNFFKIDSFVGESESSPGNIIAINKKLGNVAIFNPEVYDDIKELFDILEIVNEKYEVPPYVDLGLPSGILWAVNNLDSPYYYSWGNLEGLDVINTGIFEETYEETPANELMEDIPLVKDAVNSVMGDYWRIPTKQNFEELILECTYEWTTQNNVDGYLFTSKNNSETLFIPINGIAGIDTTSSTFLLRFINKGIHVSNGLAQLNEVQGGSVKFNQIVQNGSNFTNTNNWRKPYKSTLSVSDGCIVYEHGGANSKYFAQNYTPQDNHKYYFSVIAKHNLDASGKNIIGFSNMETTSVTSEISLTTSFQHFRAILDSGENKGLNAILLKTTVTAEGYLVTFKSFNVIDLTAIFGTGNEPESVEAFEAWLAENVGLKEYYEYTEGEVVNNNMTGIESTGFNLFNPTTGKARIIGAYSEVYGNYYGITGTYGTLTFEDDLGNVSTITPDSDGKFELDVSGYLSVADAGNDVAVFLWWDGKKTEYEDYDIDIAHLDVRHIYGKKNGTGELVQVWPTGMPRINDIVDKLCIENGAVVAKRPIGEVDMGTRSFNYSTADGKNYFYMAPADVAALGIKIKPSTCVCPKYEFKGRKSTSGMTNADTGLYDTIATDAVEIRIKDTNYTDAATLKTSLDGVLLYYELATPETYTDLVYMGSEYFADGTPVTLPVNLQEDNWGVEWIIPENTSEIKTAPPTMNFIYNLSELDKGNYWTSSYKDDDEAYIMHFDENNISIEEQYRYRGTLLRGVADWVQPEERQVLVGDIICYNSEINREAMFSYEDWLNLSDSWTAIGLYGIETFDDEDEVTEQRYIILSNGTTFIIKQSDYSKISDHWEIVDSIVNSSD